jgi:hypothetical protein
MLEYGNGVGQVSGRAGDGGQSMDVGAQLSQMVTDSVNTISALPPTTLIIGFVVIVIGLMVLKRAF